MPSILGVLGGMGPLATVDFMRKVIEETGARTDQDNVPMIVDSVPQIPCRVAAVMENGVSPLPQLLEGLRRLQRAGAGGAVIACNTAHHWFDDMADAGILPLLHIVDAAGEELARRHLLNAPVGLLGTEATLAAEVYQQRLALQDIDFILNTPQERAELVLPAIRLVKENRAAEAGPLLEQALRLLRERGAGSSILACTELPVALDAIASPLLADSVDPTRALARAAVNWTRQGFPPISAVPA
ncbi:aspartate racemase [Noviherbaspirillum humi]|uniref:Aspartate racemase n=1 Tax=Noviherbaspirillum humi TaxID=1688639 RepID=A0A239EBZ2_9BURK|nr:amino acid racemase [Noviherbaspirillum humi]SNS41788.1 aspartate racemase [Noviherbaspirillum humi]